MFTCIQPASPAEVFSVGMALTSLREIIDIMDRLYYQYFYKFVQNQLLSHTKAQQFKFFIHSLAPWPEAFDFFTDRLYG